MNYERKKKMRIEIYNYAKKLIKKYGQDKAYDLATWILHILSAENYCIWQTYDKDDIELNWGKKPTAEDIKQMQENLENCFDYITPDEN